MASEVRSPDCYLMDIEEQQHNNIRNVAFFYNTLNRDVLKTAETPYF